MFSTSPVPFYLVIVNLYVFGLMWWDKRKAIRHEWRIPESNLLFMGIIGGGLGGIIARQLFHHKTRKRKFLICFVIGILVDFALIFIYGWQG